MTAGRSRKLRAETTESHVATLIRDSGYHAFVVDRLVCQAAALTGASTACLLVRYPERSPEAVVAATFGMPPDVIASVIELGKRGPALIEGATSAQIFSAGGVRGQLEVGVAEPHDRDTKLIARHAELIGYALDHMHTPDSLRRSIQNEAEALASSMQERAGHAVPKAAELELVDVVARELSASALDRVEVELATRLFEAGMVVAETAAVPVASADAIAQVPGLQAVAAIVRHVAERWDGEGDPDGLAGERIPLASRILRACRTACVTDTPSVEALRGAAGTALDRQVVEALVAVIDRGGAPALRVSS